MLKLAAVMLSALTLRIGLIWQFPIVFGGDSVLRLRFHCEIPFDHARGERGRLTEIWS